MSDEHTDTTADEDAPSDAGELALASRNLDDDDDRDESVARVAAAWEDQ